MDNKVFRKVSMERLSSPEQLDSLMKVTSPKGWMALIAVGLLIGTAVLWGFYGSLATKLNGQGVLIRPGGVQEVFSASSGRISDIRAVVDDLIRKGDVIARIEQPEMIEQLQRTKDEISRLRKQLTALGEEERIVTERRIRELEEQQAALWETYFISSRVVSPYTGRVLEVKSQTGDHLSAGMPVITVEQMGDNLKALEAVMYIPAGEGKKVMPGMEVQISPASVNKAQYGFVLGRVISVSEFPASRQGMMITLGNEALVNELSGTSAKLEVRIHLIPDSQTVSGYQWSSGTGPPVQMNSGTLAQGSIVLKKQRPITSVIPQIQ